MDKILENLNFQTNQRKEERIAELGLTAPERKGFTVVEWGGTLLK